MKNKLREILEELYARKYSLKDGWKEQGYWIDTALSQIMQVIKEELLTKLEE